MIFEARLSARQASIYLMQLASFWRRVVTVIMILPCAAPGARRAPNPLALPTSGLSWTIHTLEIDHVLVPCNTPPPDT